MKFLLDQNLSPKTTRFLKTLGLDAHDMRDKGLGGASDEKIYEFAKKQDFILITYNSDFSRMYKTRKDLPGLILLRVHPQTIEILHPILKDFFLKLDISRLTNSISVIERHRYRIRRIKIGD